VARRAEKSWLLSRLHGERGAPWASDPESLDPEALAHTITQFRRLYGPGRYFRLSIDGLERVPPAPTLVVSNHSGGTTIPDVYGFLLSWYERFGVQRPLHLMAHEVVVGFEGLGRWFAARGGLRAGHDTARSVLRDHRRDLMVMPGGDLDTWRPYKDRYRIRFGGHVGYARIALEHDVPVVPVVNAGAHESLMVLTDGHRFARAIGLHRLVRADVWPIHLSLPWGVCVGPWPHIPLPVRIRYRVGEPLVPSEVTRGVADPVRTLDEAVRESMQGMLDSLRR